MTVLKIHHFLNFSNIHVRFYNIVFLEYIHLDFRYIKKGIPIN